MYIRQLSALLCLACCLSLSSGWAQKPQKILGIAKENKPLSFYEEQSTLWCEILEADAKNAEAWHYYYKAQRSILQLQNPAWPNDKATFYGQLAKILDRAQSSIGNTFEYHYLRGLNSEGADAIKSLQQAYTIDPDRPEVYGWLFTHHVPLFDEAQCRELAEKMLARDAYSNANLKWNYNALQTVEPNGIFIAIGDMDAIPKWVLQYGAQIRPDVLVVSKWFMASDDNYREKILAQIGMDALSKTAKAFANTSEYADYLVVQLLQNGKRPAYISSGTPREFFRETGLADRMYLVGNALKYAAQPFDNTSVLRENVEEKYYLEHLELNFQHHSEDQKVQTQMHLTYLPCLAHLRKYYREAGESVQETHYDRLIQQIAAASGREKEVLSWFAD